MSDPIYDDTDRRLMAALHAVEIPTDLQTRLERSLHGAMREQELLESSVAENTQAVRRANYPLWNRRTAIAAAVAAGLGGIALGYRQLTQPLSQAQLVEVTQKLLDQVKGTEWQSLTSEESNAVNRSLQDVGFLRQVDVSPTRLIKLQPPRNIQHAMAYDFGSQFVLFDMTIERGVQGLSHSLSDLAWKRSDTVAFAMSSKQRTLVFAGTASIRQRILTGPTT